MTNARNGDHRATDRWWGWIKGAAWAIAIIVAIAALSRRSHAFQESTPASDGGAGKSTERRAARALAFDLPNVDLPYLDFTAAWPARRENDGHITFVRTIPDVTVPWVYRQVMFTPLRPRAVDVADATALPVAWGLSAKEGERGGIAFEDPGAFLVRFDATERERARRTLGREAFVVSTIRDRASSDGTKSAAIERTWFIYYDPIAPDKGAIPAPKGVLLFMPGIYGTPEGACEDVVKAFRQRGWGVLRMLAQPSRFTERVQFVIDLEKPLDAAAERIASWTADRTAECAYAVQGAFAHIEETVPETKGLPRIALGFSGGAMTLPSVVAREPDKYAGAVTIAGGANLWLIAAHSSLGDMIKAVTIQWLPKPPTREQRAKLSDLYLAKNPLDSFHTARALKGKHVLMIQASGDTGVPSALGDVLWERLGRPDRWMRPGDHLPLFMYLQRDIPAIVEWADGVLASPDGPPMKVRISDPAVPKPETRRDNSP